MSTKILELNEKSYGRLLGRTLPPVIHSDEECERLTAELLRLDERESPTAEEEQLAELLTVLIDEYEGRPYPIRKSGPRQTLLHFMEAGAPFAVFASGDFVFSLQEDSGTKTRGNSRETWGWELGDPTGGFLSTSSCCPSTSLRSHSMN